ncbi:type II secretion system protein GspM [Variovorax sp. ZT5P49]|uniref:type II secretion system protein GspM n=1 Tax=Variovorax sp. ZT5P49 TaxID=3443733 RepID=UPI003F474293
MTGRLRALRGPMPWHGWGAALRSRLQPVFAQGQDRWRGLSRRERLQVVGMVVVVVVAAVWLLMAKPALDSLQHWGNELPRLRSQAAALKDVLADVGGPAAAGPGDASADQRMRASLDAAGLAGAYQLREADTAWQIEFERSADASRVMAWLLSAPGSLGMTVQQVTLQRSEDGGSAGAKSQVRARATVAVAVAVQRQTGNGS